jgi:hypothetical protein
MKPIFLLIALLLSSYANDSYKACAVNENDARVALAGNIRSVVKSETKSSAAQSSGFFGLSFDKEVSQDRSVKSNLLLVDIQITHEENQVCASTTKSALKKYAQTLAKKCANFHLTSLPSEQIAKADTLDEWLKDLTNTNNLLSLFPNLSNQYQAMLTKKLTSFRGARANLHTQYVKFTVIGDERARIEIGKKSYFPNDKIYLAPGEYSYQVIPHDHNSEHTITGTFNLHFHESQTIEADIQSIIDNEARLQSAKDAANATMDTISDTSSSISDFIVGDNETETLLKKRMAAVGKKSKRIEFITGVAKSDNTNLPLNQFREVRRYQLRYLKSHDWMVYGSGITYANGDSSYEIEANVYGRLQIISIGNDIPFHISSIPFIPYVELQLGLAYHEIYDNNAQKIQTHFPRPSQASEDFLRDNISKRVGMGFDLMLSDSISLKLTYDQSFNQQEDTMLSFGLSLVIPE